MSKSKDSKKEYLPYIRKVFESGLRFPMTTNEFVRELNNHFVLTGAYGKLSPSLLPALSMDVLPLIRRHIAAGCVYREKIIEGKRLSVRTNPTLSEHWVSMVKRTVKHGKVEGGILFYRPRKVYGPLDMEIGDHSYSEVGYTNSYARELWLNYVDENLIHRLREGFRMVRGVSFTVRFRQEANPKGPCIDSLIFSVPTGKRVNVHVTYRACDLTRVSILDWHMIHRIIRIIVPIEHLPKVEISVFYSNLLLSKPKIGWIARIPELKDINAEFFGIKNNYNYSEIRLPTEFGKGKDVNTERFTFCEYINNAYGL